MDAAIAHRALLKHDDVMKASMASRSRPVSVTWLLVVLGVGLVVAVEAGHWFAFWFVQQLPFPVMFAIGTTLPTAIPALFALIVVLLVGSLQNWAIRRAYLRNFPKLGIPTEIDAQFEILSEGLRLTTDRITIFPKWKAVDRVERLGLGWVLSADQLTFLVPHASFADEAAERNFIAALVDKLSPEARARSPEAAALAEVSGLA
jgi:hypothetical protein